MQGAWKVGLLVVIFVALLIGAYAILGQSLVQQATTRYYGDFADAGGVSIGTPVLMAGVKIGQVKDIALPTPTVARLTLDIDKKFHIPEGSTAEIQNSL